MDAYGTHSLKFAFPSSPVALRQYAAVVLPSNFSSSGGGGNIPGKGGSDWYTVAVLKGVRPLLSTFPPLFVA